MSYKKTEHKKALLKLVKEKRMILLIDASSILNCDSGTLNSTSKSLTAEGKIKMQKIKARYQNGNLNDVWLLHTNEVKQNEILDYEKTLINKPFHSPLVENHCYKKMESPITATENGNKVIDMQEYIEVNNYNLGIKQYKGYRVVTFADVDKAHERPEGTAKRNFTNNKNKFIDDVDYFIIKPSEKNEIRTLKIPNRGLTILTESGYLMLVKSFTDDLSWQVQRQLVNGYFKIQELKKNENINNLPEIKNINSIDILETITKAFKEQGYKINLLENKYNELTNKINQYDKIEKLLKAINE